MLKVALCDIVYINVLCFCVGSAFLWGFYFALKSKIATTLIIRHCEELCDVAICKPKI